MADNLQSRQKTDVEKDGLKGKVKSVRSVEYEAVEKHGEVIKGQKLSESSWDDYERKYDDKGNKIEESGYKSDGRLRSRHPYAYTYDD